MSIYDGPYFSLNRKLLTCIGLWPNATASKRIARSFALTLLIGNAIPHVIAAIMHSDDIDRLMLSLLVILILFIEILKMFAMIVAENNIIDLYESLEDNWATIQDEKEKAILVRYAELGKRLTVFYAVFMGTAASLIIFVLPIIPKVLDVISPLSEPRHDIYVGQGEYFIDRKQYFVALYFVDCMTVYVMVAVTVCIDTMFAICSLQCCALYAIVSERLRALRPMGSDISCGTFINEYCNSYEWLMQTIRVHQTALSFTNILNDAFSLSFLLIVSVNIVIIPLDACAMIANLNNPINLLPYSFIFVTLVIHFFALVWPGQQIVNHGSTLCDDGYCSEWYTTPLRTRKLYMIMMLRCSSLPSISAGGLLEMNYETYSTIMRTACSYIAVLSSFRQTSE